MARLFYIFVGLYLLSLAALRTIGFSPVMPASFLLSLSAFIPFAYVVSRALFLLEKLLMPRRWLIPYVGCLFGLLVVWWHRLPFFPWLLLLCIGLTVCDLLRGGGKRFPALASCLAVLFAGYAAIFNLNYLAGLLAFDRLHDARMLELDATIYGWIRGEPVHYQGMFPLVRNRWAFAFFESNYLMLYPEIFIVTLVVMCWFSLNWKFVRFELASKGDIP